MKTIDRLSYWKARRLDAQAMLEQAGEYLKQAADHYLLMGNAVTHATKKVNHLERNLGVTK